MLLADANWRAIWVVFGTTDWRETFEFLAVISIIATTAVLLTRADRGGDDDAGAS